MKLFLVEDGGEETWVSAAHVGRAVELVAKDLGYSRADYCKEFPEHVVRELPPTKLVTLRSDSICRPDELAACGIEVDWVPSDALAQVRFSAPARSWAEKSPDQIVGSTYD